MIAPPSPGPSSWPGNGGCRAVGLQRLSPSRARGGSRPPLARGRRIIQRDLTSDKPGLDDALLAEHLNIARTHAQPVAKDLGGVLAQQRRRFDRRGSAGEAPPEKRDGPGAPPEPHGLGGGPP